MWSAAGSVTAIFNVLLFICEQQSLSGSGMINWLFGSGLSPRLLDNQRDQERSVVALGSILREILLHVPSKNPIFSDKMQQVHK